MREDAAQDSLCKHRGVGEVRREGAELGSETLQAKIKSVLVADQRDRLAEVGE